MSCDDAAVSMPLEPPADDELEPCPSKVSPTGGQPVIKSSELWKDGPCVTGLSSRVLSCSWSLAAARLSSNSGKLEISGTLQTCPRGHKIEMSLRYWVALRIENGSTEVKWHL